MAITDPMESHGLRLSPEQWRKIERLAAADNVDRSAWLRQQIQALLSLAPEVHDTHESENNGHAVPELALKEVPE